jgi:RNase P subunit RPR2
MCFANLAIFCSIPLTLGKGCEIRNRKPQRARREDVLCELGGLLFNTFLTLGKGFCKNCNYPPKSGMNRKN